MYGITWNLSHIERIFKFLPFLSLSSNNNLCTPNIEKNFANFFYAKLKVDEL